MHRHEDRQHRTPQIDAGGKLTTETVIITPDYLVGIAQHIARDEKEILELPVPFFDERHIVSLSQDKGHIITSFLCDEVEPFTRCFCAHHERLSRNTWSCVILHGRTEFQIYAFISCLRLLMDYGARAEAVIPQEHIHLQRYYAEILGRHGIPVRNCSEEVSLTRGAALMPASPVQLPQYEFNNADLVERAAGRPWWAEWENAEPHATTRMSWCGFPCYCSSGLPSLLAGLIDHADVEVCIDVNAWKFGVTAMMAQLSRAPCVAINPHDYDDDQWLAALRKKEWGKYTSRIAWDMSGEIPEEILREVKGRRFLLFLNVQDFARGYNVAMQILDAGASGFICCHASRHLQMPETINRLRKRSDLHCVKNVYSPPGGTWCEDGVFWKCAST